MDFNDFFFFQLRYFNNLYPIYVKGACSSGADFR